MRKKLREEIAYHLNFFFFPTSETYHFSSQREIVTIVLKGGGGWGIYERISYHDKRIRPTTGTGVRRNTIFQMEHNIRGSKGTL
jgi:hypothetical protein